MRIVSETCSPSINEAY